MVKWARATCCSSVTQKLNLEGDWEKAEFSAHGMATSHKHLLVCPVPLVPAVTTFSRLSLFPTSSTELWHRLASTMPTRLHSQIVCLLG